MFNIDRVWGGMVGGCNRNSFMEKKVMKIINFSVTTVANWNRFYYSHSNISSSRVETQDVINSNCSYLMHPCTPPHCLYITLLLTFSCNIICVFVPRREVDVISEKMKIGIILKGSMTESSENSYSTFFNLLLGVDEFLNKPRRSWAENSFCPHIHAWLYRFHKHYTRT